MAQNLNAGSAGNITGGTTSIANNGILLGTSTVPYTVNIPNTIYTTGNSGISYTYVMQEFTVLAYDKDGKAKTVGDADGIHTIVRDFSNYIRAASTDSIDLGDNRYLFIWDILSDLRGVKQKGRFLEFDVRFAHAIDLYLKTGDFAGLSIREFVKKSCEDASKTSKTIHFKYFPCGVRHSDHASTTDNLLEVTCKRCIRKLDFNG